MDEILLCRAQKGDTDAFSEWIAPYETQVYRVCLHLTGNQEDAADCSQEAFIKAYRSIKSFRGDARPQTWLYRIAYNTCLDAMRKRRPQESLDAMEEDGAVFQDTSPQPYEQLEKKERMRVLQNALNALPEIYKSVLVLQLQGLSYAEIGQVVDISEGTVKSRVNRAKDKLKELIVSDRELFSASSVQVSERGRDL